MRWWGWSRLSEVERVDLYTRQSLYLLLWGSVAVIVLGNTQEVPGHETSYAVAAGGAFILTLAATAVLRDVSDLYPATEPLPWRSIAPFLVLVVAYFGFAQAQYDALRGATTAVAFATLAWSLGGLRDTRASVVLVAVLTVMPAISARHPLFALVGLGVALFFVFTVRISLWLLAVVTELDSARRAQAALAVAEERLRFSRDVHDVLGRRLSTIAVQSELAATLAERGDERSAARMLEVRAVAHEALREARELARGYRSTDLDQELEGARSLLRSAGIEVRLAVDGLPEGWRETAAWVVREAVTNVLRHSSATRVAIEWSAGELSVTNDGVAGAVAEGGSGLAGLRERLAPLGAELSAARDGTSFRVVAALPGDGPPEDQR
jgi:two-component system sensor histidine kinase DesK